MREVVDALEPGRLAAMRAGRLKRRQYEVQGPNGIWHTDGYDKLKPFGFCIHGTMDGWSRRMMWLQVASTNNDPQVICQYYVDTARETECIPQVLRMDPGTENVNQADVQQVLREPYDEVIGVPAVITGSSVHNQRIERWWGYLGSSWTQYYKDLFKDLRDSGIHDVNNVLHCQCLQFCFMSIMQEELDRVREHWNLHKVRKMSNVVLPSGKPDFLYFNPEVFGKHDLGVPFDENTLDMCEDIHCMKKREFGCDDEFAEVMLEAMIQNQLRLPHNSNGALDLYFSLLVIINGDR